MKNRPSRALRAAELLTSQHRENKPFSDLPADVAPIDEREAYAIQSEFFRVRQPELGPIVGYKVALTSQVMQNLLNFPSPFSGPLHEKLIYQDGASLTEQDYGRLCIECEIAAVLKTDLPPMKRPYTAKDISQAVDTVSPALEIVDDRNANYDCISQQVLTLIADNAWNAGLVHGAMTTNWKDLDLSKLEGRVHINNKLEGSGFGSDVLGHPFNALAWLANNVLNQGQKIQAGMTVMTGTMITTQFVQAGDQLTFSIPELGSVGVQIV